MSLFQLLLLATLALSINAVHSSTIYRSFTGKEELENTYPVSDEDLYEEPIYQPRFLPFFEDNAAAFGKVAEALQNPGNKTLQDTLMSVIADIAFKKFGGDETVKKVIGVVQNSQNKTFQEIVMDVAAEVAISKLGGSDEVIRQIAEVLKNPGNKTIQASLINLAADIADSKLKGNDTLKKVAEVLQKPGNRTLQENLLNVVFEVGVAKYADNELIKSVAEVYRNSGNKTTQENLLNLATNVALTQFGNNPVIKMVATVLKKSGNGTLNEKLSVMADAALTAGLGPVQAAIIKQGIGVAGQVLKVGGGLLGGALADIGGDSPLGKAGQAISNGSLAVGGLMSSFGGGDKGVGAVIEKFGESLKGKNVTVQEAFKIAGSKMNITVPTVEKDVTEGVEQIVKTEETLVDLAKRETGSSSASIITSSTKSNKTEKMYQPIKNDLKTSEEVLTNVKTPPKVVKVEKMENNKSVDVDQSTFIKAQNTLTETRAKDGTDQVNIEHSNKPLTTSRQVAKQAESVETINPTDLNDKATRTSNVPKVGQLIEQGDSLDTAANQGTRVSLEATIGSQTATNGIVGSIRNSQVNTGVTTDSFKGNVYSQNAVNQGAATALKNFGGIAQNSQVGSEMAADSLRGNVRAENAINPGAATAMNNFGGSVQNSKVGSGMAADSSRENVYSQNAVDQGVGTIMNNFGGSVQNSQVSSEFMADSTRRNVYSQSVARQGVGSYSSGALGSAAEAIEAARQALEGALGSIGGSSGNSGITARQNGGTGGAVSNIEITQVKMKMI